MTLATTTATATAASTSTGATGTAAAASATLGSNFNTFLTLLTTQLKNQDPTSPLDTNQFTSQLVQFANVEQQINTNTNLGTLIDLNRASGLYQASSMIGHNLGVTATQLSLQKGSAALQFTLASAQPVNIRVTDPSGVPVYQASVAGTAGSNDWSWNGTDSNGHSMADGLYNVAVTAASNANTAIPFTVVGTATGVNTSGTTPTVSLGKLSVPMTAVQTVIN